MNSLLLDTNVLIWFWEDTLRADILQEISKAPQVFVSAVSIWEIAIKRGKGGLNILPDYIDYVARAGFLELAVTFSYAARVETLPRHHNDPFDRMLIAQAIIENLTIVTADAHIPLYDVKTIRV